MERTIQEARRCWESGKNRTWARIQQKRLITYRTLINLPYSFLHSDNVISSLHVNRMIEFGLNVYQATWNEHTTLLIYIQKYAIQIFRIFGFENDLLIYFIVFTLLTSLSSFLILKLSYFLLIIKQ